MSAPRKSYAVSGVCCATEEVVLRKRLDTALGRHRYTFSLVTADLRVDAAVAENTVLQEVHRAGFAGRLRRDIDAPASFRERHAHGLVAAEAALLTGCGMLAEVLGSPAAVWRSLLLGAVLLGGWKIAVKAAVSLRNRTLDMNVLMTLAVVGALAIDRWSEGAAVLVLFAVALMLEQYSISRTRGAVLSLVSIAPQQASVLRHGVEMTIPAAGVVPGDTVVIRPGERIPIDGVVIEGHSFVDQATITGESTPVEKLPGATVYGGTLNGGGALHLRVTKHFEETTLAHIIHLIERAEHQRAPVHLFIDRFAAVYTPAVLGLAVCVALVPPLVSGTSFLLWLYRALVLLVIACPCALVISTPVTLVSALTNGARRGMLVKGGKHLEQLSRIRAVAFDKTGTLTEGRLRVTDVLPLHGASRTELLQIVGALEQRSEHPLAAALLEKVAEEGLGFDALRIENFRALPGRGVAAEIDGVPYYLGSCDLCKEYSSCSPETERAIAGFAAEGKTTTALCSAGASLGVIAFRDRLRPASKDMIRELKRMGVERTVVLSGDHDAAAGQMAREAGVDEWMAHLLPQQKVTAINHLKKQYGGVAMVGDGINDAPALSAASVGIAMGIAGSDTALETADVVLVTDDLGKLPHLLGLSKAAMRIIRTNIVLALTLKGIFLLLSLGGFATLWMAILADDGAALAVILNGLRMLTFVPGKD
jgi:Zn2+/Cd2+-exporting ATPase